MKNTKEKAVEALCTECGHAFKSFMDRVIHDEKGSTENKALEFPVCGCGDCKIGR